MALGYYKKYRQQYKISFYSFTGMFASIIVSSLAFDNGQRLLAGTGLAVALTAWVNSIVFAARGESNLKKAIRSFNQYSLH